jgi:hypothetical protein
LTFSASWLESPDMLAVERVVDLAAKIAQGSAAIMDAPDVDARRPVVQF